MKHLISTVFLIALGFAHPVISRAQELSTQTLKQRLVTVAGELKIVQLDEGSLGNRFTITLKNDVILRTDGNDNSGRFSDFPVPKILKHIKSGVRPFNEVIIFQQNTWGNACNGGPLWFLSLNRNGSFKISTPIDFCGGRAPVIKEAADRVTVTIPGGPPNRGTGYISGETWVYRNGEVRRVK